MVAMIGTSGQLLSGVGANPGAAELAGAGGGGLGELFSNNPELLSGLAGAGAGLLGGLFGGNQPLPFQDQQTNVAGALGATAGTAAGRSGQLFGSGTDLISVLSSGQLPPGAEQLVQNAIQKQTTDTKARFAALGQTGSTMENDALSKIQQDATAQRFQIAQQMEQAGAQLTGQSLQGLGITAQAYGAQAKIYSNLMESQMKQEASMNSTIGSFATALGSVAAKALPAILAA